MSSMAEAASSGSSDNEKQVKFTLPGSKKSVKSKVFSRSCSSAGVFGSLTKQASCTSTTSTLTTSSGSIKTSRDNDLTKIAEDEKATEEAKKEVNEEGASATAAAAVAASTGNEELDAAAKAKAKRASMVKKALRYFEDKSNRSMSEDNLFTRRKNLAVHLGLDEKVSLREIQKINTFSLPVPSSATPFSSAPVPSPRDIVVVEEEDEDADLEEDVKTKDLVRFLGMKDGVTASMASQGRLSDDLGNQQAAQIQQIQLSEKALHPMVPPPAAVALRSSSIGSNPLDRIMHKRASLDKENT